MSSSFHLPRLSEDTAQQSTVTCTLADLQAAVAEEDLGVYESSHPTSLPIGKRWLTRAPRCWEAFRPLAPIFLVEVMSHDGGRSLLWHCRLEIEGEALVQAWLRAIGDRAEQLIHFVKAGQYRQMCALVNKEGALP